MFDSSALLSHQVQTKILLATICPKRNLEKCLRCVGSATIKLAGSILKKILNHLYVANFQSLVLRCFFSTSRCPMPWKLLLVIHHEDQGLSLVVIFVGKKRTSQCQHFQQQKVNKSREMPKGMCLDCKILSSAMPSLYILLCQTTCSINIRLLKWNRKIAAGFVGVQNQQRLVHPRKPTSGKPNNCWFVSFFFLL